MSSILGFGGRPTVALSLTVLAAAMLSPLVSRAESHTVNLHFNPTLTIPPGGGFSAGVDWQFKRGFALDGVIGGYGTGDASVGAIVDIAAGIRFRPLDNHRGYLNEDGGDALGNLFLVPRIGALIATEGGGAFETSAEVGYEFSWFKPVQAGFFVRPGVVVGQVVGPFVFAGLAFSVGVGPEIVPDEDRDGVEDPFDQCPRTPIGARVDARGCIPKPPPPPPIGDRDQDGVLDDRDACPNTPKGAKVDERGCTIVPKQIVLRGIRFKFDSADIEPESTTSLEEVVVGLLDNPNVRVEIGGHSDDQGDREYNRKLSERRAESVAAWLGQKGIQKSRVVTKGYGSSKPVAPNDTEENRALNRRIEFLRLD